MWNNNNLRTKHTKIIHKKRRKKDNNGGCILWWSESVRGNWFDSKFGVGQGGLPIPAALGEVTQSARQLLIEEAGECLMVSYSYLLN